MKVIRGVQAMQKWALEKKRKGKSIGFVPTMGYLHDGHLSLVKISRKEADVTVVSIFVNPIQFNNPRDLKRYPRDEERDLELLQKAKVDVVFIPEVSEMYTRSNQTFVDVTRLTQALCGATRPGHFQGVTTVVTKLFNIVQPDIAIFGRKDYQQYLVIKQMVKDLNMPIRIIGAPLVREKDGLAMSSRNARLNSSERDLALSLSRGLEDVRKAASDKALTAERVEQIFLKNLPRKRSVRVDYVACVDSETLVPLTLTSRGHTLVAVAVFIGDIRLIDNIVF